MATNIDTIQIGTWIMWAH